MQRLCDRSFFLLKNEIDRCYGASADHQLERVLVLARLESIRSQPGQPLTYIELWEQLCDLSVNLDPIVFKAAVQANKPSVKIPAKIPATVGWGTAAAVALAAVGVNNTASIQPTAELKAAASVEDNTALASTADLRLTADQSAETSALVGKGTSTPQAQFTRAAQTDGTSERISVGGRSAFESAKALGWQAALKGQNPPHSPEHWGETADMWSQAIAQLAQIPQSDPIFAEAQNKQTFYETNLQEIRKRQRQAQQRVDAASERPPAPQFSARRQSSATDTVASSDTAIQVNAAPTAVALGQQSLTAAKRYGWQAALAAQNGPHPAEKWAEVSRLWQLALQQLNAIEEGSPVYAEAQTVRSRYQSNLQQVRQRYQQAQSAQQQLASLQATLSELEAQASYPATPHQRRQIEAIILRLQSIPTGTVSHRDAQNAIAQATERLNQLPSAPQVASSVETQ